MSNLAGCAAGNRFQAHAPIGLLLVLLSVAAVQGCANSNADDSAARTAVVAALDELATELAEDPPRDAAGYTERLRSYLREHPAFFGSATALLDRSGSVIASPYVYRTAEGLTATDLANPDYDIEIQEWFTGPLAAGAGVWTEPYFDDGGGNVWMVTRSAPIRDA